MILLPLSTIVKLAVLCVFLGFAAGFCSSVATGATPERPRPVPSAEP